MKKNDESLDTGKEFIKFKKRLSSEEQMMLDELDIMDDLWYYVTEEE